MSGRKPEEKPHTIGSLKPRVNSKKDFSEDSTDFRAIPHH
jgi:hypothetical protein